MNRPRTARRARQARAHAVGDLAGLELGVVPREELLVRSHEDGVRGVKRRIEVGGAEGEGVGSRAEFQRAAKELAQPRAAR